MACWINRRRSASGGEAPPPADTSRVELVVTSLLGLGGTAGYHTSVLVAGSEYYFDSAGINVAAGLESHEPDAERTLIGFSQRSGRAMARALRRHFDAGSYDKLRKNCNSFSDACLYFLLGERLPAHLRRAEQVGRVIDERLGALQTWLGDGFARNAHADDFDLDALLAEIDAGRALPLPEDSDSDSDSSDGESDGGSAAGSGAAAPSVCSTAAAMEDVTWSMTIAVRSECRRERLGSAVSLAFSDVEEPEAPSPKALLSRSLSWLQGPAPGGGQLVAGALRSAEPPYPVYPVYSSGQPLEFRAQTGTPRFRPFLVTEATYSI